MKRNVVYIAKGLSYALKLTQFFAQFSQALDDLPSIQIIEKPKEVIVNDAKTTIELAKIRTQIKKLEKQLSVREDAKSVFNLMN